jgi:hypothetical protein
MENKDKMAFLAESIKNAKKVLDKVENNNFSRDNTAPVKAVESKRSVEQQPRSKVSNQNTMKNISESKMPPEIIKSFIDKPIIDPTAPFGMEAVFENIIDRNSYTEENLENNSNVKDLINEGIREFFNNPENLNSKFIKNIVNESIEQLFNKMQTNTNINENIQIKIGGKVFHGKIGRLTEVNNKKQ